MTGGARAQDQLEQAHAAHPSGSGWPGVVLIAAAAFRLVVAEFPIGLLSPLAAASR